MNPAINNSKLINLLTEFNQERTNDKFKNIYHELMNGEVYLLVPSIHDNVSPGQWNTLAEGTKLKMTSVYNLDGLKVIGVFTSEEALMSWAKEQTQYTAMMAKDVLALCQENGIDRVVIDSHLPTMFVLQRNSGTTETVPRDTAVTIGTPSSPIQGNLLAKLKKYIAEIATIDEAYQYVMTRNNEHSLILAFNLNVNSDNARHAAIHAVQNSFEGEKFSLPVDVYFIEDDETHEKIRSVTNSLIYSKHGT